MGETRGITWNLWAKDPVHDETRMARGSYEHCTAEQTYLTSMAEQFDGRDPYPRRIYSIEKA
jgi:hypothetical protein